MCLDLRFEENENLDTLEKIWTPMCVWICKFRHNSIVYPPEMETLNNFCLSRLSQVCPDFYFLQITNLDAHVCPDFFQVCIDLRQKRCRFSQVCSDFDFHRNANL